MRAADSRVVPSERERVLTKLDKILSRAKSANIHEAATARRIADELMDRYGLTDADLKKHADAGYHELSLGRAGFNAPWKFMLATAAARYSGCEAIALQSERGRRVCLAGERAAVEQAAVLFDDLLRRLRGIERAVGKRLASSDRVGLDGSPRQCADSFRRGAVASIVARLIAIRPGRFGWHSSEGRGSGDFEDPDPAGRGGSPESRVTGELIGALVLGDKRTEHAERIRQKYAPRTRSIDLDEASSLTWYWIGYDAADRLVTIQDDEASDGKDG